MNITQISHRIEIAFWTTLVAALRSPHLRRLPLKKVAATAGGLGVLLLVAALLSLVDFRSPQSLQEPSSGVALAAVPSASETARPANGQSNLLVLLVDRINASDPQLEGVWLLARLPDLAQVTFLPVFPTASPDGQAFDRRLEAAFDPAAFDAADGRPAAAEFHQILLAQGLWWDHYIMVDRTGLAQLIELAGGISLGDSHLDGRAVLAQLPEATRDPQIALETQSQIARELCSHSSDLLGKMATSAVTAFIHKESRSDLEPDQLRQTLRSLQSSGAIVCQFPISVGR